MKILIPTAAAGLVVLAMGAVSGHAQPGGGSRQGRADVQVRFSGPLKLRAGARIVPGMIDYRTWTIPPTTRSRLDLPPGRILVELHSGKLLTVSGDQQQRRQPGEFWMLQPGETMTIQTEDDTAILNTIVAR